MKQDYAIQIFCYFLTPKKLPSSGDIPVPSSESQILVADDTQTESLPQCSHCTTGKKLVLVNKLVYSYFIGKTKERVDEQKANERTMERTVTKKKSMSE